MVIRLQKTRLCRPWMVLEGDNQLAMPLERVDSSPHDELIDAYTEWACNNPMRKTVIPLSLRMLYNLMQETCCMHSRNAFILDCTLH